MRYYFEFATAAKFSPPATHPYQTSISLPKSEKGWRDADGLHKTAEEWLKHVERKLLLLNITDAICVSTTPDQNHEGLKFRFYFINAAQGYQFKAATIPNKKGDHSRNISASSPEESAHQEKMMRRFLEEHEMAHGLHRMSEKTLIITTSCTQDDLIIAMQIENKTFNMQHTITPSQSKIPTLFRSNENV